MCGKNTQLPMNDIRDKVITLDDQQRYQMVRGFGASLTESSAVVINALPEAIRQQLMQDLFSPEEGIGLSRLRQPIGASDFALGNYTYADTPDDFTLSHFSLE